MDTVSITRRTLFSASVSLAPLAVGVTSDGISSIIIACITSTKTFKLAANASPSQQRLVDGARSRGVLMQMDIAPFISEPTPRLRDAKASI
jgi:hypothetical protein